MANEKRKSPFLRLLRGLFGFVGLTLLLALVLLLGVIWELERGPSPTATEIFCRSVQETSAIKWIANIFLTTEQTAAMLAADPGLAEDQEQVDATLIHVAAPSPDDETDAAEDGLEIIDIHSGNIKGKLMIVQDPRRVIVGTSDGLGRRPGLQLTDLVAKYDGIAGINGGGFNDQNGTGDGGTPRGVVICDGEIVFNNSHNPRTIIGLNEDGVLIIGSMMAEEALERGIRWGVSFEMDGAINGALVVNGEVQQHNLASGVNPRTAIGQREDGALLLLVLDGRHVDTLGATLRDVCDVMLDYGAVNVGNLDGGSSSVMVYDGEIINNCASITGPRYIPDGFVVLREVQP